MKNNFLEFICHKQWKYKNIIIYEIDKKLQCYICNYYPNNTYGMYNQKIAIKKHITRNHKESENKDE